MNPLEGCFKGYRKCVKACYQPERCRSCSYLNQCCHGYCLFPPASSRAIDEETGDLRQGIFEECMDFILRGKGSLSKSTYEFLKALGLIKQKEGS